MNLFDIIPVRLIDLFEILLVAVVFYRLYMTMRGTLAVSLFVGLLGFLFIQFLVQVTGMKVLQSMFSALNDIYVLAAIIVFQPEIRRILILLGQTPLLRRILTPVAKAEIVPEIVAAVSKICQQQQGALIAFKRASGLRSYIETGETLQAAISSNLLVSVFNPVSPLHDGAVIIADNRIEAVRCILPVSRSKRLGQQFGTRHRAAVGLTEETDAFVVVVSEETGKISVAEQGVMISGLTIEELESHLSEALTAGIPGR
ncbi:MAG: diadenylate cyclase CdaA [Bacteroidetes bacterium]|nr:diadenylate cyclase CdaA [Bacteroidota bacterium]